VEKIRALLKSDKKSCTLHENIRRPTYIKVSFSIVKLLNQNSTENQSTHLMLSDFSSEVVPFTK
jgi:hypothetical protein